MAIVHMIRASHGNRLWQFDPTVQVLDDIYEHLGEIIDVLLKGEANEVYKPHIEKVSVHSFSVVIDAIDKKYGHPLTPPPSRKPFTTHHACGSSSEANNIFFWNFLNHYMM